MADPFRVAVIGAGAMGANHVRVLGELPGCELIAVADPNERRLPAAVRGYRNYAELLAEERPDAAVIAVPTRLHAEIALACIDRGVALLVEKPLAAGVEDAARIARAAEGAGVPLMVGHIERFNPVVQELKHRLDGAELGRVLHAHARRVGPFFERERDVGVVHDLATHDIDVLRYLLGREIERVQAETVAGVRTEFEDALSGLLRFEGGAVAALEVSWLSPVKVRELMVLCERGLFVADEIAQELRRYDAAPAGAVAAASARLLVAQQEPLRAELAAFLRVARGLEPPPVGAADAIAALRIAEAVVESAGRGAAVTVGQGARR